MNEMAVIDRSAEKVLPQGAREPVLSVSKGSKIYGGVHAIEGVDFDLYPGEVHALVGENGAGKSTLCKAIAGAIRLTSGTCCVDGKSVDFQSPRDALAAGICMVYQETSLVPTMTAAQNIELGNEKLLTRFRTLNIQAQQLLQSLNFHVDPAIPVALLGTAKRQMVEIARAIYNKPVSSSRRADHEPHARGDRAFLQPARPALRRRRHLHLARARGTLKTPITVAARRQGDITAKTSEMTREKLVRHMVGRDITQTHYARQRDGSRRHHSTEKVLTVENVTMGLIVKNMSFSVYAGEVVGIAGLIGSGRTEIAKIVYGALKRNLINGGMIYLRGKPIRYRVPKQAINDGICYITEDRKANGYFETMRIDDNVYVSKLATKAGWSFLVSRFVRNKLASYWIERLKIAALLRKARIVELSGGNQQKVVIASLGRIPRSSFDEPTCGVDVGTHPRDPCPDPLPGRRRRPSWSSLPICRRSCRPIASWSLAQSYRCRIRAATATEESDHDAAIH
jgi:ABC-type sugar transport system ATPase subunit